MGSLGCLAGPSGRTLSQAGTELPDPGFPGAPLIPETLGFPLGVPEDPGLVGHSELIYMGC